MVAPDTGDVSMNVVLQSCTLGCGARPQPHRLKQRFTQPGSRVELTIWNIPAAICPRCHQSFVEEEVAGQLGLLCIPFHGSPGNVPDLPPAKVSIDYAKAVPASRLASSKSVMVYEGAR